MGRARAAAGSMDAVNGSDGTGAGPTGPDGFEGIDGLDDLDPGTVVVAEEPFDPSTIRDPLPQPLFSWRRLVVVAALALAALCLVVAARSGGDQADSASGATSAIVSYQPVPGGRVLRQSEIGVVLEDGWDGRLTINGVAIPEDEMVGAIDPNSDEYLSLPEELRDQGPRPNNKNVVMFQPGPGQAITEYDTGTVEVTVRYWRIADGAETARTTTYTVRVF